MQKEYSQIKAHIDFEFIDPDIKDEIDIDDAGNYCDNATATNFYNSNINNVKHVVTLDLFNQQNYDDFDENCSTKFLNIEVKKLHEETITHKSSDRVNDNSNAQKKDTALKTNQNCRSDQTGKLKTINDIPHVTKYKNRVTYTVTLQFDIN